MVLWSHNFLGLVRIGFLVSKKIQPYFFKTEDEGWICVSLEYQGTQVLLNTTCQDGRGRTKWQPNYNPEKTADVKSGDPNGGLCQDRYPYGNLSLKRTTNDRLPLCSKRPIPSPHEESQPEFGA